MSKLISVRVPVDELERIEKLLNHFPGASPALLIRALLLAATPMSATNALAKHAAAKVKGGKS